MVAPATDPASHNSCNWCNSWEEKKTPESCASPPQLSASSKPAKPGSRSLPKAPQANEVCCSKPNNYPYPNNLRSRSQLNTHNSQLRRSRPSLPPSLPLRQVRVIRGKILASAARPIRGNFPKILRKALTG
jgi:hypothetical protein